MNTIYDTARLELLRKQSTVQPHSMKHFRNALFKKGLGWEDALALLPASAHDNFRREIRFESLALHERHDSAIDAASKLVFKTDDGHLVESVVLRPKTGRTSICISSQVGCACRCGFCATGMMGFSRNLTLSEILDQISQSNRMLRSEDRLVRNVVFMGMGEPLLNFENVCEAVGFLVSIPFFNLSPARVTVSTVGIPPAMVEFSRRYPDVQLALSLHSARQDVRQRIMPLASRYSLAELRAAMDEIAANGKIMIEYLMLAGINDSEDDLLALEEYLRGLPVHVNIIPFNEHAGCEFQGTPRAGREVFLRRLKAAGFDTTLRYSLGSDIAAACGQLADRRNHGDETMAVR